MNRLSSGRVSERIDQSLDQILTKWLFFVLFCVTMIKVSLGTLDLRHFDHVEDKTNFLRARYASYQFLCN